MTGSVGLGLSVVGSLVEDMGGSVAYENHSGWARFVVQLPIDASQVALPEPVDPIEERSAQQASYLRHWLRERRDEYLAAQSSHDG